MTTHNSGGSPFCDSGYNAATNGKIVPNPIYAIGHNVARGPSGAQVGYPFELSVVLPKADAKPAAPSSVPTTSR
jgi:hypothetical protein